MSTNSLTATYSAPTSTQVFSSSLPALPDDLSKQDVQGKTAYLSALRSQATEMQNDVNTFLTQKMEEDKAAESGSAKNKAQEEKEEEMYGEEDPEGDG